MIMSDNQLREGRLAPECPKMYGRKMTFGRHCAHSLFWIAAILLPGAAPSGVLGGQTSAPNQARSAAPPETRPPRPTLSDFAWLEGKWQGAWGPRVAEEVWTAPKAGQMLGLFRVIENDKTLVIELFSLFETPDGVALRFRHFTPALVPWEQSGLTTMKLTGFEAKSAVFENSAGGQPKRAAFNRIDPDTYISKSEIMPADGSSHSTEITYHRQK
jgi:hypothetical protein